MTEYKELLIGCGKTRDKRLWMKDNDKFKNLITLDIDPKCNPDVVWDLRDFPLPFGDNEFDEIHAYEVLEHTGQQGDYKLFFNQFSEFWRVLKPNGIFVATVPMWNSEAAWSDPSHTRVITPLSLVFLDQKEYEKQVGKTPMTDFRNIYFADFEKIHNENRTGTFIFGLRAIKPSRYKSFME